MYRTATNLEDLDFELELNSYDSVMHAVGRSGMWAIDKKYKDVDFYIMMNDNSEEEDIKKLLNSCGMTAYLEYKETSIRMVKIGG
jgi:hypothetical protein